MSVFSEELTLLVEYIERLEQLIDASLYAEIKDKLDILPSEVNGSGFAAYHMLKSTNYKLNDLVSLLTSINEQYFIIDMSMSFVDETLAMLNKLVSIHNKTYLIYNDYIKELEKKIIIQYLENFYKSPTPESIDVIHGKYIKYPYSASVYAKIMQRIKSRGDKKICGHINNLVLAEKRKICNDVSYPITPSSFLIHTFGMTRGKYGKLLPLLNELLETNFAKFQAAVGTKTLKEKNTCIILLSKITHNPVKYDLSMLLDSSRAKYRNSNFGPSATFIKYTETIEYCKPSAWSIGLKYLGDVKSAGRYIVFETIDNVLFQLMDNGYTSFANAKSMINFVAGEETKKDKRHMITFFNQHFNKLILEKMFDNKMKEVKKPMEVIDLYATRTSVINKSLKVFTQKILNGEDPSSDDYLQIYSEQVRNVLQSHLPENKEITINLMLQMTQLEKVYTKEMLEKLRKLVKSESDHASKIAEMQSSFSSIMGNAFDAVVSRIQDTYNQLLLRRDIFGE